MNTIHNFKEESIEGSEKGFACLKGKKMMIISVA